MGTPTNRRRSLVAAAVTGAAATAAAALLVALTTHLSPVPVVEDRPAPQPAAVTFDWSLPTERTVRDRAPHAATDAERVLDTLLSDDTFSVYDTPTATSSDIYGGPYTGVCPGLYRGTAPVAGRMRRAMSGSTSLTVTAWAYGAGQAAAVTEDLRSRIAACTPSRQPYPLLTATSGDGFSATASNGGDGVSWTVRTTGDLVVAVTATTPGSYPSTAASAQVADRLTGIAGTLLRQAGCRDLSPTVADAGRNPYTHRRYTGLTVTRQVTLPAGPGRSTPALPPSGYRPPTWEAAPADPVPALAVPLVPSSWPADEPLPELEDLPAGPAPVLADPDAFTPPDDAVTSEPYAPARPAAPQTSETVALRTVDRDGPGCGWAFTGTPAAVEDPEELAVGNRRSVEAAVSRLTLLAATHQLDLGTWSDEYQRYLADLDRWRVWTEYASAVGAAQDRWDEAESAYDGSVDAYDTLVTDWLSAQPDTDPEPADDPEPMPTPEPTDEPTTTPEPTDEPTTAPTTPAPEPTPSPDSGPAVPSGYSRSSRP